MKLYTVVAAVSAALLLVLGAAQGAEADASIGGTSTWNVIGAPTMLTLLGSPAWLMTFHNGLGQTVYYSTGSITLTSLGTGSVYIGVVGVPAGNYNATFFAFDPSGVAISAPTSAMFIVN